MVYAKKIDWTVLGCMLSRGRLAGQGRGCVFVLLLVQDFVVALLLLLWRPLVVLVHDLDELTLFLLMSVA